MSAMKDLDYRVKLFGEMLYDERIEEYETQVIEMERGENVYGHPNPQVMVELLQDMKKEWSEKRVMSRVLATMFEEWLHGDEGAVQAVLESDDVDFEVIGCLSVWTTNFLGGLKWDEI